MSTENQVKESKVGNFLNKYFHFYDLGGNMKNEIYAGISMFIVSLFIILFNTQLIHDQFYASEVYPTVYFGLYFGATLISFVGSIVIGLIARLPLVQVSGLGMSSALISLVGHYSGLTYANIMAISLVSSIIYTLLICVPFVRKKIFASIPSGVKKALPVLVGLIIALICLKNGKLIDTSTGFNSFVLNDYLRTDMYGAIYIFTILAIIISYVLFSRNKNGHPMFLSLIIGLGIYFVGTACYGLLNISNLQLRGFLLVVTDDNSFGFVEGIKALGTILNGNDTGSIPSLFQGMWDFSKCDSNTFLVFVEGVITFLAVGLFGSYGIGKDVEDNLNIKEKEVEGNIATKFKNRQPSTENALLTVGITNIIIPFLGGMPTDLTVSNTVGKKDNAKTGLASIVSGLCFLLSMFTMAIIALFATDLGSSAYGHANEYNLTITGVSSYIVYIIGFIASLSLIESIKNCDFKNKKEYIPLIITTVIGFFTMNITLGMASGCLTYLVMILLDKNINKKENLSTIIGSSVFSVIGIVLFAISIM